jgi:hypothetical protein
MAIKEFDKDKLNIDAPNSNDIGMMNDDMETEDEVTVDPRQLYKRFEDMWTREGGMP